MSLLRRSPQPSPLPSSPLRARIESMVQELITASMGKLLPVPPAVLARPLRGFLAERTDLELIQMLLVGRQQLDQLLAVADPAVVAEAANTLPG